jgi:hypothetical protein
MRPKVVWAVIAAAVLLLGVGYIKFQAVTPGAPVEEAQTATATLLPEHRNKGIVRRHDVSTDTSQTSRPTAETDIAEMNNALLEVNEKTLPLLCAKLAATDRQVRRAAVSNLVILADRDAVPALAETLDRATDSDERANIQSAIDFLKLPAYNELVANGTIESLGKTPPNTSRLESETYSRTAEPQKPTGSSDTPSRDGGVR